MFENVSLTTKILMGVTVAGAIATTVSAIKDVKANKECCLECCDDCVEELVDPAAI